MDETTEQIETVIESKRDDLQSNFEELEGRVRSMADWRQQFRRHPGAMLGAVFGAGLLLASLTRRQGGAASGGSTGNTPQWERPRSAGKERMLRAWDDIQDAVVGVVATQLSELLGKALPGFKEQLTRTKRASGIGAEGNGSQGQPDKPRAPAYGTMGGKVESADTEGGVHKISSTNERETQDVAPQGVSRGPVRSS